MKEKDWCDTCKEPWASERCNTCKYGYGKENNYKPMTNADRIRGMSDEELAKWMSTKVTCMRCPVDLSVCQNAYYDKDGKCDRILLDWLKAPVEEVQE